MLSLMLSRDSWYVLNIHRFVFDGYAKYGIRECNYRRDLMGELSEQEKHNWWKRVPKVMNRLIIIVYDEKTHFWRQGLIFW